ncbi:MAG: UTP--glucose-1-phosphate uridylyltransferase [Candidatus Magasanikbacteria bacterium]|nr:UTP--glucose-1-phosphate uridylyltransferase [Candidatus Magasanikbacteria bacterium]
MPIRKAIIPVAGLGTRFLPAAKAQPKEMLAIVDKPTIQYIVEEAVAAGITQIIFVTSQNKRAIEDHFDRNFELEYRLRQKKKKKELGQILDLTDLAQFVYVRQRSPKGDGHAILTAREIVGNEPCAVFFGDDVMDGKIPAIKEVIDTYERYNDPVIGVYPILKKNISRYGAVGGPCITEKELEIKELVEKPSPEKAPSNLAVIGRYVITPEFFDVLARTKPDASGEIRLANAARDYIKNRSMYARILSGTWYDTGSKLGFLKAQVAFGLKHPDVAGEFRKYIKEYKM